jgi:sugar fermentation stimulation protein A
VRFGTEGSRVDLFLSRSNGWERCFVEVKNVTAAVSEGVALFPDAVSARGTKHLRELMGVVRAGDRAVLLFCVQRSDAREVRPADAIDPLYGRTLREAIAAGVEVLAYRARLSLSGIELRDRIPVVCP